jgi:hypothetical protein
MLAGLYALSRHNQIKKGQDMPLNLKQYAGQHFIKPDDVRDHPLRKKIAGIVEGKFKKPDLTFEDGDVLSLNGTNVNVLRRKYGDDSEALIGKVVELYLGQLKYNGTLNDAVIVNPLSPADKANGSAPADDDESPAPPELDDKIPF